MAGLEPSRQLEMLRRVWNWVRGRGLVCEIYFDRIDDGDGVDVGSPSMRSSNSASDSASSASGLGFGDVLCRECEERNRSVAMVARRYRLSLGAVDRTLCR